MRSAAFSAIIMHVDADVPAGAEGYLFGQGGRFGGHALYLLDGRLVYHYNLLGVERFTVTGPEPMPTGPRTLTQRFDSQGAGFGLGATVTLLVDESEVVTETLPRTVPWRMSYVEGLNVGRETGTPVSDDYTVPFAFTGGLRTVRVQLR